MILIYILLSAIIGFIIGIFFSNKKLFFLNKKQKNIELKKNIELETNHEEIIKHFIYVTKLLDEISYDYYKLYQHIIYYSSKFLPDNAIKDNPFDQFIKYSKIKNENDFSKTQPKDY